MVCSSFFFFKQKTAYEMRIRDWSSDVCSSDLAAALHAQRVVGAGGLGHADPERRQVAGARHAVVHVGPGQELTALGVVDAVLQQRLADALGDAAVHPIGRAACRERVCQYGSISVVDVSVKKQQKKKSKT